jgi:hypothetical protein
MGGVYNVSVEQEYLSSTISYDNYVFPDLTDTIFVTYVIDGWNIESFCPFFVPFLPLPVTWGQIICEQVGGDVIANVVTLSEANTQSLSWEVSNDAQAWNEVEVLPMKFNSNSPMYYTFTRMASEMKEYLPLNKMELYSFSIGIQSFPVVLYSRWRQIDYDGGSSYTDVIPFVIRIPAAGGLLMNKNIDLSGRMIK